MKSSRFFMLLATFLLAAIFLCVAANKLQAQEDLASKGKELFVSKGCVRCHSIGQGKRVGPDLAGVALRYDEERLFMWASNPEKIYEEKRKKPINEGYPPMPPWAEVVGITKDEIEAITAFLTTLISPPPKVAENGVIRGRVVERSGTEKAVPGIEVTLTTYVENIEAGRSSTKTNEEGAFEFTNLSTDPAHIYDLSLIYKDGEYRERTVFNPGGSVIDLDLDVYEPTTSDESIKVEVYHLIVQVQVQEEAMIVTEIIVFYNEGDRTYIGVPEGDKNKRRTIRFMLPAGATNVQLLGGLMNCCVSGTNQGFVDTIAFKPGVKRVIFSYTLPYEAGKNTIESQVQYPTENLGVLVSDVGAEVSAPGLTGGGKVQIADGTYFSFSGSGLKPNSQIILEIKNPISAPLSFKWVAFGVAMLLLGMGVVYSLVKKSKEEAVPRSPALSKRVGGKEELERKRKELIGEIAALDDEFEGGKTSEEEYKRVRSQKKAELIDVTFKLRNLA